MNSVATLQQTGAQQTKSKPQSQVLLDLLCFFLPVGAFALWYTSLGSVHERQMTALGLVSVMPPSLIAALVIMLVSFYLTLQRSRLRVPLLLLHIALLIFMLYGVTTLVEEAPRFNIVYRHAGYTEYIMRTGTVDPNLDAYFSWPGFFSFSAFLTKIAGYPDILPYAVWAPVFYNALYFGPLYIMFSTFTPERRIVWLAILFFYLTNWIGQDYFSPQGLNFFLYLVIIAILLKWFKTPPGERVPPLGRSLRRIPFLPRIYRWLTLPDLLASPVQPRKGIALLGCILIVFAFVVFSHQLTPFFVLASVLALILFRRCTIRLWWLPLVMAVMTGAWIVVMTQSFLAGHLDQVIGGVGHLLDSFSANVSNRVAGNPQHTFIARFRIIMTFFVWMLAFIGFVVRLRKGYRDSTVVLLALTPFPLFIVQPYGGEMLLRCYLFSLPAMVFLAAALFYSATSLKRLPWRSIAITSMSIMLLLGFLFTRYGNESMDYKTFDEVKGVRKLYSMAQPGALFVAGWDDTPWQIQDFEKYTLVSLSDDDNLSNIVAQQSVSSMVKYMRDQQKGQAYLIFTRSQKATFDATSGLPAGMLDQFENKIEASGNFILVYRNQDAQVFKLVSAARGGR